MKQINSGRTILTIVVGFLMLFLFFEKNWMIYAALAIGVLSLVSIFMSDWIVKIWYGIARILGFVNSRILLSVIYYIILLPLSLVNKLSTKQAVILNKGLKSYFVERNHRYIKEDFEKPW